MNIWQKLLLLYNQCRMFQVIPFPSEQEDSIGMHSSLTSRYKSRVAYLYRQLKLQARRLVKEKHSDEEVSSFERERHIISNNIFALMPSLNPYTPPHIKQFYRQLRIRKRQLTRIKENPRLTARQQQVIVGFLDSTLGNSGYGSFLKYLEREHKAEFLLRNKFLKEQLRMNAKKLELFKRNFPHTALEEGANMENRASWNFEGKVYSRLFFF